MPISNIQNMPRKPPPPQPIGKLPTHCPSCGTPWVHTNESILTGTGPLNLHFTGIIGSKMGWVIGPFTIFLPQNHLIRPGYIHRTIDSADCTLCKATFIPTDPNQVYTRTIKRP